MPLLPTLLGLLGVVPFIVCGLGALNPSPETAGVMLQAFIGYAAIILAFSGGVEWGFALQTPSEDPARPHLQRARLALPIGPLLVGWIALLLQLLAMSWLSLVVLIAGYIGTVLVEHEAARRALLPPRYIWLRWGFTIVAVAMLVTVLTLRLLGQTVKF